MAGSVNPKIAGSIIIGFALVAGAFTITNFGKTPVGSQTLTTQQTAATLRLPIEVSDNDQNGIEDWRDDFIPKDALKISTSDNSVEYVPPTTLTGKTGIHMVETMMQSKLSGPLGKSGNEIADNTVETLARNMKIALFNSSDIEIMPEWEDQDIVNYANTVAATLIRNSDDTLGNELEVLYDAVQGKDAKKIDELKAIAAVYQAYIDDTLKIPVPKKFAKQHLDLINTYQAIHEDLIAMSLAFDDPLDSFLHLKRYQDDVDGLVLAFRNMYSALEPHADLFVPEDPAVLFVLFSPDYQP